MKIAILGAGKIGSGLGEKWVEKGHQIIYGVRDPQNFKYQPLSVKNVQFKTIPEAAGSSEILVLAIPFPAVKDVLKEAGSLKNKLIIDTTNAVAGVPVEFESAAEAVKNWSGSSRVIKAFNSTGSANLRHPVYQGMRIETLICGDDVNAKKIVQKLAEEVGFEVIDVGGLNQAILLEYFAKLWIHLAYQQGMGTGFAFKLLKR
jgi:predicted dinucleotide-binding enzyme